MKYSDLKSIRKSKNITQVVAAQFLGVSLRSYKQYENDKSKRNNFKYKYMCEKLGHYGFIDEDNGILTIDQIKNAVIKTLKKYGVSYCYLFGSYANGTANEKSNVNLLVSGEISGMAFFSLSESLHEVLFKKVDLISVGELLNDIDLINFILKDGVKII